MNVPLTPIALYCVEYYGLEDQTELIGAVDIPAAQYKDCATRIGILLCSIRRRYRLTARIINGQGEIVDKMVIYR